MTKLKARRYLSVLMAVIVILGIGALAVSTGPAKAQGGTWTIETVDDIDVWNTSLALDSQDNPHISYTTFDLTSLHYAHRTGAGWATTTVDTDPTLESSLALDSSDQPNIGYSRLFSLDYAYRAGGVWTTEPVLPPGQYIAWDCSLALDSTNQPHMSSTVIPLLPGPLFTLIYTYRTDEGWQPPEPVSLGLGFSSSLALDRNDRPCVSYSDGTLMYARFIGGGWTSEPVDPDNPGEVVSTSLALDSNERPNIAYATLDAPGSLHFARWTGSGWASETVDPSTEVVDCSLALDSQNHPHICYFVVYENGDIEVTEIKYAEWTGQAWEIQTIDQETTALDAVPMKTFNQEKMDILKQKAGALNAEFADRAGQLFFGTRFCSIALDSDDLPHISYGSLVPFSTSSLHYASFSSPGAGGGAISPSGPNNPSPPMNTRQLDPPQLSVQYLNINPQQTAANQPVTITTNVVNTGDQAGSYNVALKINGQVEQSRMISVGPQASQPVKFTVTKAQPGTYTVDIAQQKGSFTIGGDSGSGGAAGSKTGAIMVLALIGVLIIASLVVLLSRRI